LIGIGSYNGFQYYALRTSSPVNVTLIAAAAPVWMVLVGLIGYRVCPTWRQAVGSLLSFVGVIAVLSRGSMATLVAMHFVAGDLFMLPAGLAWAIAGALVEFAFHPHYGPFTPKLGAALAFVALGPAVIAYWAWGAGVARVGPTVAALFSNLTPLFAALLVLVLLGEAPHWYHALAFALIAGGIVASAWR
jgi:drug/metabolite transporter (DMT)-like permease